MGAFELKSPKQYVASSDKSKVDVYELTRETSSNIRTSDWNKVATIATTNPPSSSSYDALKLFNREIKGQALRNLADDLVQSRLFINRQGFCFIDVVVSSFVDPKFGVQYFRAQDLFSWSQYGVNDDEDNVIMTTVWNPSEMMMMHVSSTAVHVPVPEPVVVLDYGQLIREKDERLYRLRYRELREEEKKLEQGTKELEEYQKLNYFGAPSNLVLDDDNGRLFQVIQRRRRACTLAIRVQPPTTTSRFWSGGPRLDDGGKSLGVFNDLVVVDQEVAGNHSFGTIDGETKDGRFDNANWWYLRTTHPDGGTTLIAYYEGSFAHKEVYNGYTGRRELVPLPYSVDANFRSDTRFYLACLSSLLLRIVVIFV